MANFSYKTIDQFKNISSGTISGLNRDEVAQILTKKGLTPLVIKLIEEKSLLKGTVPIIDKITFCRYLSIMLSTGLSISEGVEVLHNETKNPLFKKVLSDMAYSLEQGQQLSSIFERYPSVFENYFITLTRAGEVSGKLADVFKYLEMELRAEYSLNSKVKGALLYPAIVTIAMVGIGILMFFFVLPQIGKVFLSLKLPLPAFTTYMFQVSIAMSKYTIQLLGGGLLLGIGLVFSTKIKEVKNIIFSFIRKIPVVKNLIMKIDLARFNRIFSTLLRSAVPITEALEISLSSLSWSRYVELAKIMPEEIKKGKTLSSVIKKHDIFPSLMVQMVAAGERTATLDSTLSDMASFYEEEVEEEVKNLTQIIEPVLMLFVGIGVGAMILSIIAPIYSVVGNFQDAAATRPH